jgi:predicted CXXCH cytochrome family protein
MSTAANLTELHRLHLALREVQEQLVRGPRQIKAREQLSLQAQADLEAKRKLLLELRKGVDRKQLDLKTNEARIADLRRKLNTASSNREYEIISGQIDADTMANSVLEDEILELMEKVDRAQHEITAADEKAKKTAAEKQRFATEFEAGAGLLRTRCEALTAEVRQAESGLTGDVGQRYRRLVEAHGADALAPVEGGVCTSCHVQLTPQSKVLLNSGGVLFCGSCGRLLYLRRGDQ